jgi:hypothetical protein
MLRKYRNSGNLGIQRFVVGGVTCDECTSSFLVSLFESSQISCMYPDEPLSISFIV